MRSRFEYKLRPGGYAVVVHDHRVAVVRTSRGIFLPGGGVENNESLAETAVRETKEETGLIIKITGEIGTADEFVSSRRSDEHFRKVCTFFSAEALRRTDTWEHDHELIWVAPGEGKDLLVHGSQKWAVSEHFGLGDNA